MRKKKGKTTNAAQLSMDIDFGSYKRALFTALPVSGDLSYVGIPKSYKNHTPIK